MSRVLIEPVTRLERVQFTLRDTANATRLFAMRSLREVDAIAVSIVMPLIFILVFNYIFGGSVSVPGGRYNQYLLSGMLPEGMLFAAGTVAVAVAADMREGVIDRFRVMPITRSSVLLGRAIATGIAGMPSLAIMAACAFAIGLRPQRGIGYTIGAFVIMFAFAWAMTWIGFVTGLLASGPAAANGLSMAPSLLLSFVSNVYVDPHRMPVVLRVFAEYNPLSTVVGAVRQLFGVEMGPAPAGVVSLEYPVPAAIILILFLDAVLMPWSVRLYMKVR